MREAARNAKAHLLRASAAADAGSVEQQPGLAQSNFLELSVDDRVVVKLQPCPRPTAHTVSRLDLVGFMHQFLQGRLRESAVVEPTAVQQAAIPAVLSGRNVAMQCYTGSGKVHNLIQLCMFTHHLPTHTWSDKPTPQDLLLVYVSMQTLAYLLPVLTKAIQSAEEEFHRLQQQGRAHEAGTLQALVIVPSRELAMQIVRVAQGLLPHEARATIQQCIGGANPNRQVSCSLHVITALLNVSLLSNLALIGFTVCDPLERHYRDACIFLFLIPDTQFYTDLIRHLLLCVSWPYGRHCT